MVAAERPVCDTGNNTTAAAYTAATEYTFNLYISIANRNPIVTHLANLTAAVTNFI